MIKHHDFTKEQKTEFFGEGLWVDEPDRVLFEHLGIECILRRVICLEPNGYYFGGHICGYCILPLGHPLENKSFEDIDLSVHGGITYVEKFKNTDQTVIGFDCGHLGDLLPSMLKYRKEKSLSENKIPYVGFIKENYKDMDYVMEECKKMAKQISEIKP